MKLTLSLDKETIEFAHKLAKESNDSISNNSASSWANSICFFRHAQKRREEELPMHPTLKHLAGRYKNASFPNDKRAMLDILLEKHLK